MVFLMFLKNVPSQIIEIIEQFETYLFQGLANPEIVNMIDDSLLRGGKRIRPLLVLLVGRLLGVRLKNLIPFSVAAELIHAASLAHDDVIDNATTRRGRNSINIQTSNRKAIVAGDYLLADVLFNLSSRGNIGIIRELSMAVREMSEGEFLQMHAARERNYSRETIEEISARKTGSLMGWCCQVPAIFLDAHEEIVGHLSAMGRKLGIGYQLMDDVLDFRGNSGKRKLIDLENGMVNSVVFEFLENSDTVRAKYLGGGDILGDIEKADMDEAIDKVKKRALTVIDEAVNELEIVAGKTDLIRKDSAKETFNSLRELISYIGGEK